MGRFWGAKITNGTPTSYDNSTEHDGVTRVLRVTQVCYFFWRIPVNSRSTCKDKAMLTLPLPGFVGGAWPGRREKGIWSAHGTT